MTGTRLFILTCCWLTAMSGAAQKKEFSAARDYIKSGKDLDKAERLMADLTKSDAANRENIKIYLTWYEAVMLQYEAANEKLYLRQKYDTAAFFNLTKKMYDIASHIDSLDMRPDSKGRIRTSYRKQNAADMNLLRPNLYYGGTYNIKRGNYETAYDFLKTYIESDGWPLFTGFDYMKNDSLMPTAAYWALYCGYKLQDAERIRRFGDLALHDTDRKVYALQYLSESWRWQQNDSTYVNTLREGFREYPEYPYFFPRLADYYQAHGQYDAALSLAEEALAVNPGNPIFLMAKSLALLNLDRYDESIAISEQLIAKNDTLPEPYYNIATAYLNKALDIEQLNEPRLYRTQLQDLYQKARPHMEKFRELQPEDASRWAPALYRVYLHLNQGKQFDEIDKVMKRLNLKEARKENH